MVHNSAVAALVVLGSEVWLAAVHTATVVQVVVVLVELAGASVAVKLHLAVASPAELVEIVLRSSVQLA